MARKKKKINIKQEAALPPPLPASTLLQLNHFKVVHDLILMRFPRILFMR